MQPISLNLDEFLKIPPEKQDPKVLQQLKDRRKELADKFFNKETSYDEKMKIFDELFKLHQYFGYKLPNKPYTKGTARIVTAQEREANCDAFMNYLKKKFKDLPETAMIDYLPIIWSNTK